jgi:hypothetical protein
LSIFREHLTIEIVADRAQAFILGLDVPMGIERRAISSDVVMQILQVRLHAVAVCE